MKMLRVLMLNGSSRANGNTSIALREMEKIFAENGVAVETVQVGNQAVPSSVFAGQQRPELYSSQTFCYTIPIEIRKKDRYGSSGP